MKPGALLSVVGLALLVAPATAQTIRLDLAAAYVTDRNVGVQVELPAARGPGLAATLTARIGRFEGDVTGVAARLHLPEAARVAASWQTFGQAELRLRYRLIGPLAVEAGVVGRMLDPDPNGAEVGFVTTGAFARWPIARGAWIWGRLGVIPWATFEGGGGSGFAAETAVGVELQISGRIRASAAYGFQRLDRDLSDPDGSSFRAPVEHDVLRIGIRWPLRQAVGAVP